MIGAVIAALAPVVSDVIDRAFPDSAAREQAKLEAVQKMQDSLNRLDLAQMEVNKQEAAHNSAFVAGWRPFIGWVCGAAFAYHFVLQPLLAFAIANYSGEEPILPDFDMEMIGWVLGGMLGIGGMRTFEKVKGVTK